MGEKAGARQHRRLAQLRVASPCNADWDAMRGDDRVRHCEQCKKNVYNLSALPADLAERLLEETDNGVCVTYYQRADGTVISGDCSIGLRRRRRRALTVAVGSSVLAALHAACGPALNTDGIDAGVLSDAGVADHPSPTRSGTPFKGSASTSAMSTTSGTKPLIELVPMPRTSTPMVGDPVSDDVDATRDADEASNPSTSTRVADEPRAYIPKVPIIEPDRYFIMGAPAVHEPSPAADEPVRHRAVGKIAPHHDWTIHRGKPAPPNTD